jgi:pantoate--beta-alanine ligase
VDYVAIRRAYDLEAPSGDEAELVILASAWLGKARLIDNIPVTLGDA